MNTRNTLPTRDEIAFLAGQAGVSLDSPYFDELVESYKHVHAMLLRQRECMKTIPALQKNTIKGDFSNV